MVDWAALGVSWWELMCMRVVWGEALSEIGQLRKMGDRRTFELYREVFILCQAP